MIYINIKTMKALDGSIKKWELIVEGKAKDEGRSNCPLCQLYNKDNVEDECRYKCPIGIDVENRCCYGTPYILYNRSPSVETAQAMLDYLTDLKTRCRVARGAHQHWKD